jgi:hypothetical protein
VPYRRSKNQRRAMLVELLRVGVLLALLAEILVLYVMFG